MPHPSDLGGEMQIINPLGQGTAPSHRLSRVWRSRHFVSGGKTRRSPKKSAT
jgi:hypothetical protein